MRIAIIHNNKVDTVTDAGSIDFLNKNYPLENGYTYIDGTGLNPGDVRDAKDQPWYAPPPIQESTNFISVRDFLDRLTVQEWDAVNDKVKTDHAMARLKDMVLVGDDSNPGYINLKSAELSGGIDYAISLGLISANRKSAILS